MCGIVGYIGNKKAKDIVLGGLKRLEYRGYDSAGISTLEKNGIITTKTKGKISDLVDLIETNDHNASIGIGHTRWATHGEPNTVNAHPHIDYSDTFSIIHNGIIENHFSIKTFLAEKGIKFNSDTDTEVLVQLIGYIFKTKNLSFFDTVKVALKEVVGAYGIIVMKNDEPNKLIAARHGSPLILGLAENEKFIASDPSAILEHTRNILYLDDDEIVEITANEYKIRHLDHEDEVVKQIKEIEYDIEQIEKGDFEHFMLKEIFEQPASIKASFRGRINEDKVKLGGIFDWTQEILSKKYIYLTACGTSYYAALIGSYILESIIKRPVKVEYASEFRYRNQHIDSNSLVIAISQSGETADTLTAVKKSKESGALTLGIVNVVGSSIARETDCGVYMHAGPEIGVASTKAFTSQVITLSLFGNFIAQHLNITKSNKIISDIQKLPYAIEQLLKLSDEILNISKKYYKSDNFLYLGRGYQFPVALEGALKLKEISYIHAEGYPAAEMKHGPIALIDDKMPVVVIVTQKRYEKVLSNIQEVKSRGGKLLVITTIDTEDLRNLADDMIYLDYVSEFHSSLTPILTSIPLQLLAYHIAVLKGCNVDQPRNLAKSVTVE
tara:strand:- start:1141 stop:2973 length:1833 start_codon:yes stop_codon:yes gene_type:complete